MNMHRLNHVALIRCLILGAVVATAVGCAGGASSPVATATATASAAVGGGVASTPAPTAAPGSSTPPAASQEPDTGTTSGDVPDNAVFLTYHDPKLGYSIQYVEGWQVTPDPNGVSIRDKDSSEVIQVVPAQADVAAYVSGTDLAALQQHAGFKLAKQDDVTVAGKKLVHLVYDIPSLPDPVTGKQVPSIVDRYYVPGQNGLAIVSLATPKGVDNVDAFRQMIESFRWA
jgi:hypothetical protein